MEPLVQEELAGQRLLITLFFPSHNKLWPQTAFLSLGVVKQSSGCFGLNNSDLNKPLEKHNSSHAARCQRARLCPAGELSPGLG